MNSKNCKLKVIEAVCEWWTDDGLPPEFFPPWRIYCRCSWQEDCWLCHWYVFSLPTTTKYRL